MVLLSAWCSRLVLATGLTFAACSPCLTAEQYEVVSPARDWGAHPAIVDLPAPSTLYAISDVHGGYERLVTLLSNTNVTTGVPESPASIDWAAGDATLIVVGDLFDKGPQSIEVLDALIALDASARSSGGRVVVTVGNHEAEFLADPTNCKANTADGVDAEMRAHAIDPMQVASGADARGAWLRDLPFAARVGRWFFAHAGNTKGRSVADLEAALMIDVSSHDYTGGELLADDSLLESRDWFDDGNAVVGAVAALGVDHIVFGHSPHALGPDGTIAVAQNAAVFRIDCGMSPDVDYSHGEVLRVRTENGIEIAEALTSAADVRELWRAGP